MNVTERPLSSHHTTAYWQLRTGVPLGGRPQGSWRCIVVMVVVHTTDIALPHLHRPWLAVVALAVLTVSRLFPNLHHCVLHSLLSLLHNHILRRGRGRGIIHCRLAVFVSLARLLGPPLGHEFDCLELHPRHRGLLGGCQQRRRRRNTVPRVYKHGSVVGGVLLLPPLVCGDAGMRVHTEFDRASYLVL